MLSTKDRYRGAFAFVANGDDRRLCIVKRNAWFVQPHLASTRCRIDHHRNNGRTTKTLGIDTLGLDPGFAIKYLVYFLIVIAVGGSGSIIGTLLASIVIGVVDVAGKYFLPQFGAFLIYTVMVATLIIRPQGFFGHK